MKRFIVRETTETRTTYIVEAENAAKATKLAKRSEFQYIPDHSVETHYVTREFIKEEE